jgi:hypothetical protein
LPLPAVDLGEVHFLTVEMTFGSGASVRTERVFDGEIDRMIDIRNTAVAIEAHRRRDRLESAEEARGLILAGGEPATPVGLEDDGADWLVVRDRSAHRELVAMTGGRAIALAGRRNDRTFLISPAAHLVVHRSGPFELFPITPALPGARGSLLFWLSSLVHDPAPALENLAAAVSVAGMRAASGGRPRAVLLVVGPESLPVAAEDAARARRFLARLGVPLAVWRIQRDLKDVPPQERMQQIDQAAPPVDRRTALAEARAAWGEVEDVASPAAAAAAAAKELLQRVDRQQVVWIDGEHLPTEITLVRGREIRLAGRE